MDYLYNTPQEAIISLEKAYTNQDLNAVIDSKDFVSEAKLILSQSPYKYDLNDNELISETANLLKTTLIRHLQSDGYPNFEDVTRQFSEIQKVDANLYIVEEKLIYPNGEIYTNNIYLSCVNEVWKVVSTE